MASQNLDESVSVWEVLIAIKLLDECLDLLIRQAEINSHSVGGLAGFQGQLWEIMTVLEDLSYEVQASVFDSLRDQMRHQFLRKRLPALLVKSFSDQLNKIEVLLLRLFILIEEAKTLCPVGKAGLIQLSLVSRIV